MKKNVFLFTITLAFLAIVGCEMMQQKMEKPDYLVSINEIIKYPRASQVEKEITTIAGTKKWISSAPYIFSNCIQKIEAIPNQTDKNFFDLKLKLNYRGKLLWSQLGADILYKEMGFIVNDVLYRKLSPDMITTEKEDLIILKLKLDQVTAKAIADSSEANYKYFNPDDK